MFHGQAFYDVTQVRNRFVAVGWKGAILISDDGINWCYQSSNTSSTLTSVFSSDDQIVAVGEAGVIVRSPDGVNWVQHKINSNRTFRSVTCTEEKTVVCGDSGVIYTSDNGVEWIEQSSGTYYNLRDVVWGDSQFVVVGDSGVILTSKNGSNWISRESNTKAAIKGVVFANNKFVATFDSSFHTKLLFSTDGITWTTREADRDLGYNVNLCWTGQQLMVSERDNEGKIYILASSDGVSWREETPITLATYDEWGNCYSIYWTGFRIVVLANDSYIYISNENVHAIKPGHLHSHQIPGLLVKQFSSEICIFTPVDNTAIKRALNVYTLSGKKVADVKIPHGEHVIRIPRKKFSPGCYQIRYSSSGKHLTKKIQVTR